VTRDANQIAQEAARREPSWRDTLQPPRQTPSGVTPVRGALTIWDGPGQVNCLAEFRDVVLDLTKPGLAVIYSREGDAMVYVLVPGWLLLFEPSREGE
jgi:hypothetical protein